MAQPPILKAKINDHPALRDLAEFVVPKASVKWYNLGLQLFDPQDKGVLDSISVQTNKSSEEQCREVFNHWLTTKKNATWNKLIRSLKSQSVRLPNVAREIEKMLDSRSIMARGTHKIKKRLHLQSSQIPSTIAEGSSSYDSSDAVVENDESDEETLQGSPGYSRYTFQRNNSVKSLCCRQTSMPMGTTDYWLERQVKSQSVSTASLPATLHSMEHNFQQTKSMLEELTKQLNVYKDKYEREYKRSIEIEDKLSEVNKEKLELEKEIKNQLTLACEKKPTAEKVSTLVSKQVTQKLDEELNIRVDIFEKQIKKVTDTFNKQLNDSEEAHRKELCDLQLKVDEKVKDSEEAQKKELYNLQLKIEARDEMYKEQITKVIDTLNKHLKDSEEAYSKQIKVEVLEKEKIQKLQDIEETHRRNIGRISEASKSTKVKYMEIATVPQGKLEAGVHLNEKSTELLTAKEQFKLKEADLIHQIEELKHQVEELKNACKKSERISKDSASKLNEVNENYRSTVAKKDSELKACQQSLKESSLELTKAKGDIKLLQTAVSTKHSDLENCRIKYVRSLNEKSTELVTAKEEFKLKEADLIRQIEGLKHQVEELKNSCKKLEKAFQEKDSDLAKTKESYQTAMAQKNEALPRKPSETPKSKVRTEDKDVQTESKGTVVIPPQRVLQNQPSETKVQEIAGIPPRDLQDQPSETKVQEIAGIPPRDLQDQVDKLKKENSYLISRLTALEEQSFKFTNAFTTADEGSVIKLRDTYRYMQTNGRPAANRAHKKDYKEIPSPILDHTMLAYEEAKKLAIQEFEIVSERFHSLFQLSTDGNPSQVKQDKAMMQSQQLLESFHAKPLNEKIYQMLIDKYKALTNQASDGIPKAVDEYYSSLAKFTWDCVARPIPMVLSKDAQKFDGGIHEIKDGDGDGDDNSKEKFVSYIYPVLFTSNSWPREIAMKGEVNVLDLQETIV